MPPLTPSNFSHLTMKILCPYKSAKSFDPPKPMRKFPIRYVFFSHSYCRRSFFNQRLEGAKQEYLRFISPWLSVDAYDAIFGRKIIALVGRARY